MEELLIALFSLLAGGGGGIAAYRHFAKPAPIVTMSMPVVVEETEIEPIVIEDHDRDTGLERYQDFKAGNR